MFFQIDRLETSFTDSVSVSISAFISVIPFPNSGFRIRDFSAAVPRVFWLQLTKKAEDSGHEIVNSDDSSL